MKNKTFPQKKYKKFIEFHTDYTNILTKFLNKKPNVNFDKIIQLIQDRIVKKKTIFVCGNGGSSAISNHYVCDYIKSLSTNTNLKPRVISLNSNSELISAISNDISYNKIFSYQMNILSQKGDLLILISSSGDSKNLRDALKFAKKNKITTIGFSGFAGGYLKKNTDVSIHIDINNYGITEDLFQIYMHIIMQYLRQKNLKNKDLNNIKF
jgi:D-sedoheptulose 7-phosphate isomerase